MTEVRHLNPGRQDVLAACVAVLPDRKETLPVRRALRGIDDLSAVSFEEWVQAMRTTDGRLCLEWPGGQLLTPNYATVESETGDSSRGVVVHVPVHGGNQVRDGRAEKWMRDAVDKAMIQPIRREETAFAEDFE